jgi:DNA end-binding protein Ku
MARRPIWRGSLSFGLVQIPVGLFSAERPNELDFDLLDKRDMARVGYQKINKSTGEPVDKDDIVKGFQYEKGEYVIVDEEEFKRASSARSETIDIIGFVDGKEIDPVYYERPYYVAPTGKAAKAFVLLREVLRESGQVAIASVVLRTKKHIGALFPRGPALVLEFLRYADEIREVDDLDLPAAGLKQAGVTKKEIELAEQLVKGLAMSWDPAEFHDTYREELLSLIEQKATTGKIKPVAMPKAPRAVGGNIIELLRRSVREGAQNTDQEVRPARRRHAVARGTTRKAARGRRRARR